MNTREELIVEMENIVKRNVKDYQTDFYNYDLKHLQEEKDGKYFWQVRKSGTWLLVKSRSNKEAIEYRINFYREQCPSENAKEYVVDLKNNTISKWDKF